MKNMKMYSSKSLSKISFHSLFLPVNYSLFLIPCSIYLFLIKSSLFHFHLRVFLFFILLFISLSSRSQQITFCESVDSKGNPVHASQSFAIPADGGFLEVLVSLPTQVNATQVTYDLFQVNEENKEIFESTIKQDVKPVFSWFSKKITFRHSGAYNVYVYDEKDRLLCTGRVYIRIQR